MSYTYFVYGIIHMLFCCSTLQSSALNHLIRFIDLLLDKTFNFNINSLYRCNHDA